MSSAILSSLYFKKEMILMVLPPGYRKYLICHLFAIAASLEMEEQQTVLVVCPLKSIIKITEAQTIGILAASAAIMHPMKSYFQRANVQQHFTYLYHCLFPLVLHFDFWRGRLV